MNVYNCFSQTNGFSITGIKSDLKNTGRTIYLFQNCELLQKAITKYKTV